MSSALPCSIIHSVPAPTPRFSAMSALFLRLASSLLLGLSLLVPASAAEPLSPAQKDEVERIMQQVSVRPLQAGWPEVKTRGGAG